MPYNTKISQSRTPSKWPFSSYATDPTGRFSLTVNDDKSNLKINTKLKDLIHKD